MKKNLLFLVVMLVFGLSKAQTDNSLLPKAISQAGDRDFQVVEMPAFDVMAQKSQDAFNKENGNKHLANRFGYEHIVSHDIMNSGTWMTLEDGGKVWRLGVSSENALSLNLIFNDFYLAEGATVHFYSADGTEIVGAYTADNNNVNDVLGTELISGDEGIIELYEPAAVFGQSRLQVGMIVHGYEDISHVAGDIMKALNTSGDCNMDVNCLADDGSGWENQRNCVAMLVNGGGFCTGSLINNTANDGTPYFITANHCGDNQNATVFRFRWESPNPDCATTTNSTNGPENFNVNGSVVRATIEEADVKLVELNSQPDDAWNIYYNGWDVSDLTSNVSNTRGIHHPDGDIKKICVDDQAPTHQNGFNFNGFATDMWWIADWDQGVTEPGSSGSPLFRQDGKTIGVLSGGAAACNGTVDNDDVDYYGRLGTAWEHGTANSAQLKFWLDPSNTGDTEIEGYDPNFIALDNDVQLTFVGAPASATCGQVIAQQVRIRNAGTNPVTSVEFTYGIVGDEETYTWTGNLASGEVDVIMFDDLVLCSGMYTYQGALVSSNLAMDENPDNDTFEFSFEVIGGEEITIEVQENANGSETSYIVVDDMGVTVLSEGPFDDFTLANHTHNLCLPAGNYTFTINDTGGDGLTPVFFGIDVGYYRIVQNGVEIAFGDAFGSQAVETFTSTGSGVVADFSSTVDGGTVNLEDMTTGATPTTYEWYAPGANVENGMGSTFEAIYANAGTYNVTLTIKTATGCETVTKSVTTTSGGGNGGGNGGGGVNIDEIEITGLSIYPNPSDGMVTIEWNSDDVIDLQLYNIVGELVIDFGRLEATNQMQVADLASGIYVVRLESSKGIATQKLVIR